MRDTIEELLEAHVRHELSRLSGDSLPRIVDEHVAALFEWFGEVKFNDAVTREQILGVIERYVIDLRVAGGITELAGEMANAIFSSEWSANARVKDVCDEEAYEEFAEKVLSLDGVLRDLLHGIMRSSAFAHTTARVLSRVVLDVLLRGGRRGRLPLQGVLSDFAGKVLPDIEEKLDGVLLAYIERHAGLLEEVHRHVLDVLDPVALREMADEIWDAIADKPISNAISSFTAQDLEDFVVLSHEFWLRFRKTKYFRAVVTEVVDRLFAKYGDESLTAIIEDMGISDEMIRSEVKTFLVPLFDHARDTGFMEKRVRAILEPFYRSPEARAILK